MRKAVPEQEIPHDETLSANQLQCAGETMSRHRMRTRRQRIERSQDGTRRISQP